MGKDECLATIESLVHNMPSDFDCMASSLQPGTSNYPDTELLATTVQELFASLGQLGFERLPYFGVDWPRLEERISLFADAIDEFNTFSLKDHDDSEVSRKDIVDKIGNACDVLQGSLLPYEPLLIIKSAGGSKVVSRLHEATMAAEADHRDAQRRMNEHLHEIEAVAQAAKDAAARVGVEKFATSFATIAEEHEDFSRYWLAASAIFGSVSLGVSACLVLHGPTWPAEDTSANANVVPYVLTKLVFVSMLYFISFWSARNYKSHRHLAVVNRHRQNSLSTFQTFVEASSDPQTKDAVLLEATRCIFSPAVTGYLGREPEPPANRIIEIVKSLGPSE